MTKTKTTGELGMELVGDRNIQSVMSDSKTFLVISIRLKHWKESTNIGKSA